MGSYEGPKNIPLTDKVVLDDAKLFLVSVIFFLCFFFFCFLLYISPSNERLIHRVPEFIDGTLDKVQKSCICSMTRG